MFPYDEFKLTRKAVFALLVSAAFSQTAEAAPAGTVIFAAGDVSATAADGQVRLLLKGTEVAVGDTIVTGSNGRAQIRFTDGAFSSFQPETRFRVDQYQYEGKTDGSEKGFFSLLKGALRTVTGAIGHVNKKNYQVATPTATIGIRGTEYLAREGNSLSVSVGEGQIEICNAAGCLIVTDGESAFVKDPSTQPTFTQQKTQAGPPPPPPPKPDDFKVAENRDTSGGLTVIPPPPAVTPPPDTLPPPPPPPPPPPTLVSGPGYLGAFAGHIDGLYPNSPFVVEASYLQPGVANFDAAGALTSFSADDAQNYVGTLTATAGVIAGGFTDGVIGWGRWDSGTGNSTGGACSANFNCEGSGPLKDVHYVIGQPTPATDMVALNSSNIVGTYSLLGFTYPTALDYSGVRTVGTQPVTGSLTANFGSGSLNVTLGVPIGGNQFGITGSAYFYPTATGGPGDVHPATFSGWGSVSGTSYGYATINGLFVGANASRAGLVYQFDTYGAAYEIGIVSGAATFQQTFAATPLPGYLVAMAGQNNCEGPCDFVMSAGALQPGNAYFNAAGALISFSADGAEGRSGTLTATAGVVTGGSTDGVIGWGRWASGNVADTTGAVTYGGTYALQDVHYIVGQPTPAADMLALYSANTVGTYTLLGFTYPTALDSSGVRTVGTQPVTGSLTANFGSGSLNVTLGVPIGGNQFDIAGSASFSPTSPGGPIDTHPAAFSGSGSVSGASGAYADIKGMFVGAMASRAGLVYQFDTYGAAIPIGTVSGAATFKR